MLSEFVDNALRVAVDAGINLHLIFAKIADNMAVVGIKRVVGMAQPSVLRNAQSLPFETKLPVNNNFAICLFST